MKQSYIVFNCRAWLVAVLLCFVSLPCWAEEADGLVYEVDSEKKTATVTGVTSRDLTETAIPAKVTFGETTYNVTAIGAYAFSWCSKLKSVTIPNGVTTIGNEAFSGCSELRGISLPESVTSIGGSAFAWCYRLETANIPSGVTIISDNVFNSCIDLTSITIPAGVTSIGEMAFWGCSKLASVTIPASVSAIGDKALSNCRKLTSISVNESNENYCSVDGILYNKAKTEIICFPGGKTGNILIPKEVTSVDGSAFEGCYELTSIEVEADNANYSSMDGVLYNKNKTELVCFPCGKTGTITVPDGVVTIGTSAFNGCSGLSGITLPESVTTISDWAFYNCFGLTSLTLPSNVSSIGAVAFCGCSELTSINIPKGVVTIGESTFGFCSKLTEVTLHEGVTSIGKGAFTCCDGLTSITIPEGVLTIGDAAFLSCFSLESITIPKSVTSIGSWAFNGGTPLNSVTCLGSTPPAAFSDTFGDDVYSNATLYVSGDARDAYKEADVWKKFQKIATGIEDLNVDAIIENGQIVTGGSQSVEVYDLAGRVISRGNVGQLPKGIYIVVVDGKASKVVIR